LSAGDTGTVAVGMAVAVEATAGVGMSVDVDAGSEAATVVEVGAGVGDAAQEQRQDTIANVRNKNTAKQVLVPLMRSIRGGITLRVMRSG
jgi:hypothetical protein